MTDSVHIVCPHCQSINRVPLAKVDDHPNCGRCQRPLFSGEPIELRFDATILPRLARPPRPPYARRDPALIQRVVRERYGEFRGCYEDGLRRDVLLTGRVSVRFVIGADGKVSEAESADPELPDVRARQCVRRVFEGLVFPPGDGTVTVTYPIMFSPAG